MALVRVARIADLTEAKVIASALEANDIPVMVQNGQMGSNDFLMQAALGGFGILVPEERAREAATFIREHRSTEASLVAGVFDDASPDEADREDADPTDDEDWSVGRARRRGTVARWVVVALFLGPTVLMVGWVAFNYLLAVARALIG